jgi:hypothetical protein
MSADRRRVVRPDIHYRRCHDNRARGVQCLLDKVEVVHHTAAHTKPRSRVAKCLGFGNEPHPGRIVIHRVEPGAKRTELEGHHVLRRVRTHGAISSRRIESPSTLKR